MDSQEVETGIYARTFEELDRSVQIGVAQGKVISVSFPEGSETGAESDHPLLDRIAEYIGGAPIDFSDVDVGLTVPTDQRAVLETVRTIPYGEDVSVEQIGRMVPDLDPDDEADRGTIREALVDNPTPVFVPDHRVSDVPGATPEPVTRKLRRIEEITS